MGCDDTVAVVLRQSPLARNTSELRRWIEYASDGYRSEAYATEFFKRLTSYVPGERGELPLVADGREHQRSRPSARQAKLALGVVEREWRRRRVRERQRPVRR